MYKIFCSTCKLNKKFCRSPASHPSGFIPETFVGHGGVDPEETDQVDVWSYQCINRGSLGSASLLTSTVTLVKGDDSITVEALWDPGSESSFFSAALLPFAVSQRDQSFKIETLSPSATRPEVIHGVEAVFQVAVPGGEMVNLRLLQHSGLENRQMKLKPKLLTCSTEFAKKYDLKKAGTV